MNKKPFKVLYIYIITGFIIGSLISVFGFFKIIPKEFAEMIPSTVLGLIVLIIDLLFIWAWIYHLLRRYVHKNGISTTGIIKSVIELPHPKELNVDEWCRKVRYSCIISYKAGTKEYNKEFPPTCLISKQELYPFVLEKNTEIEIKYMNKIPKISFIDNEKLTAGYQAEHQNDIIHLIMIPLIVTVVYVILLVML